MARIEVFADILCPFTHVGLRHLVEMRATTGKATALRVRAWPLELINGAPLSADLVGREIEALREIVAPGLFAGFDPGTFPRSSMPAFGLAAAAYCLDDTLGEAVSLGIRDALFEQGRDVADPREIGEIGEMFGVVPLAPERASAAVNADWERGRARGVKGSPHFVVGDRDWFCPSLRIRHDERGFRIENAEETTREFYAMALG
jgi:predicted DsbA family dithiol-disulfide isomerase